MTQLEFISVNEGKTCFFCKNAKQFKKHKFVYHNHLTAWVCVRCLKSLGGKLRVQQILSDTSFPLEELNYARPEERFKRFLEGTA